MPEKKVEETLIIDQIKWGLLYGVFTMLVYTVPITLMQFGFVIGEQIDHKLQPVYAELTWFLGVVVVAVASGIAVGDRKSLNIFTGGTITGFWNGIVGIFLIYTERGLKAYHKPQIEESLLLSLDPSNPDDISALIIAAIITLILSVIVLWFTAQQRRTGFLQSKEIEEEVIEIKTQTTEEYLESELQID